MTDSSGSYPFADDVLWEGLQEHVRATMGIVGIPKMLSARDDEDAGRKWVGRARPALERLASLLPVSMAGPALYAVGDQVEAQFGIHDLRVLIEGVPTVRTMIAFDPAPAVLAAVGERKWGREWLEALAKQGEPRPVAIRDGVWSDTSVFPWVAQKPGTPGPWTAGVSEHTARTAGLAEDLGFDPVSSLFREFVEGPRA